MCIVYIYMHIHININLRQVMLSLISFTYINSEPHVLQTQSGRNLLAGTGAFW
jgi:hypothetical protein